MTTSDITTLIESRKGVVLYFKNDHCGPCKALRPKIQDLIENKFIKMHFQIIDTLLLPELTQKFNVFSNPTILVFFEGKEYIRKSAFLSVSELEQEIDRLYQMVMNV
ncbi:MAG: thioredoxin family protein [Putridiphycobacter sp.]